MSDWTSGYVADIGYTHGFYQELTPARLELCALISGHQAPDASKPLTYCELGCGQGFSMNVLAAANPQVQFHATDFNPSQIAGAQALAADAGLSNVTFYDHSFAEFTNAPGVPAKFDVIALHGIYSWISAENQAHIVDFIARRLRVGGLVYISYNALPGWAAAMPLRRLFVDNAATQTGPIEPRVDAALEFVEALKTAGAAYFGASPGVVKRFDSIKTQARSYLAHEYFNRDWTPFYFADVAADLSVARLGYVGSTALLEQMDAINLTEDQQAFLKGIGDRAQRETVRDFMFNRQFRKDIFARGPVMLGASEWKERWMATRFALTVAREDVGMTVKGLRGDADLQEDVYIPVLDRLVEGPMTCREMAEDTKISQLGWTRLKEALTVLVGAGHVQPCLPAQDEGKRAKSAKAFNQVVLKKARDGADLQFLASPVLGSGVVVGRFQQLFLLALAAGKKHPEEWADFAWEIVLEQGQLILKDGKTLDTPEDNLAELVSRATEFATKRLPVLRSLGLI